MKWKWAMRARQGDDWQHLKLKPLVTSTCEAIPPTSMQQYIPDVKEKVCKCALKTISIQKRCQRTCTNISGVHDRASQLLKKRGCSAIQSDKDGIFRIVRKGQMESEAMRIFNKPFYALIDLNDVRKQDILIDFSERVQNALRRICQKRITTTCQKHCFTHSVRVTVS